MENSKPVVINLFGGPGCGKSTTAAAVFSILKLHDINVELVTEYAKDLTWENRSSALNNQYYVWAKQHHRLYRVMDKVNVIVTDSPLILSITYSRLCGAGNDAFTKLVLDSFDEFNNFNFLLRRTKKYNPVGRYQDEDGACDVDLAIRNTLAEFCIPFIEFNGDWTGINKIVTSIFSDVYKSLPGFCIDIIKK